MQGHHETSFHLHSLSYWPRYGHACQHDSVGRSCEKVGLALPLVPL